MLRVSVLRVLAILAVFGGAFPARGQAPPPLLERFPSRLMPELYPPHFPDVWEVFPGDETGRIGPLVFTYEFSLDLGPRRSRPRPLHLQQLRPSRRERRLLQSIVGKGHPIVGEGLRFRPGQVRYDFHLQTWVATWELHQMGGASGMPHLYMTAQQRRDRVTASYHLFDVFRTAPHEAVWSVLSLDTNERVLLGPDDGGKIASLARAALPVVGERKWTMHWLDRIPLALALPWRRENKLLRRFVFTEQ